MQVNYMSTQLDSPNLTHIDNVKKAEEDNFGYFIAQKYLNESLNLNKVELFDLFSKKIVIIHTSNGKEDRCEGKDNVVVLLEEKFFKTTKKITLITSTITITSDEYAPCFTCITIAEKIDNNSTYKVKFHDRTTLRIIKEEEKWKIVEIKSTVEKTILSE